MCAPRDLKQRIDPSEFERYEIGKVVLYIQRDLLAEGILEFAIPGEGGFALTVRRSRG